MILDNTIHYLFLCPQLKQHSQSHYFSNIPCIPEGFNHQNFLMETVGLLLRKGLTFNNN